MHCATVAIVRLIHLESSLKKSLRISPHVQSSVQKVGNFPSKNGDILRSDLAQVSEQKFHFNVIHELREHLLSPLKLLGLLKILQHISYNQ